MTRVETDDRAETRTKPLRAPEEWSKRGRGRRQESADKHLGKPALRLFNKQCEARARRKGGEGVVGWPLGRTQSNAAHWSLIRFWTPLRVVCQRTRRRGRGETRPWERTFSPTANLDRARLVPSMPLQATLSGDSEGSSHIRSQSGAASGSFAYFGLHPRGQRATTARLVRAWCSRTLPYRSAPLRSQSHQRQPCLSFPFMSAGRSMTPQAPPFIIIIIIIIMQSDAPICTGEHARVRTPSHVQPRPCAVNIS